MKRGTDQFNRLSQRANWFLLLVIVALGGFLRFYQIGSKGLWLDEAFSVWMGWQPVSKMLGWLVKIDQHPPLYYTLLHFWMTFGDSAAIVRAPSALLSTLTIPVIYLLGRRLSGGDQMVGLLAALILAVSPFHVRFAQEARMYAPLAFNASLATYALARLLTDSRSAETRLGQQFVDLWQSRRDSHALPGTVQFSHRTLKPSSRGRSIQPADYPQVCNDLPTWQLYHRDTENTEFWNLFLSFSVLSVPLWLDMGNHRMQRPAISRKAFRQDAPGTGAESVGKLELNGLGTLPLQAIETDLAWLGYIIFTAATLWTHNTAIFFPIATNIFVLGSLLIRRLRSTCSSAPLPPSSPSLRNWLVAQAGVLLIWLPWLGGFVTQTTGVYREFWIPEPTCQIVLGAIGAFLSDFLQVRWAAMAWAGYVVLGLLGMARFRRRPARLALLLVLFLTPFAGEWLVSLRRPIFYDRTLIWASIPLYVLLAAGIRQLRYWPCILAIAALAVTVNGISLHNYYTRFEKEQWDDAARLVAERVEPDDLILFNATWVQIPFDFYFRSYGHTVAEHGVPADLFDHGILEPKVTESDLPRLRTLIQGRERVWLVYSHDWYADPQGLIPVALEEELDTLNMWEFYGLQVQLYSVQ